jgi:hypothetical protein
MTGSHGTNWPGRHPPMQSRSILAVFILGYTPRALRDHVFRDERHPASPRSRKAASHRRTVLRCSASSWASGVYRPARNSIRRGDPTADRMIVLRTGPVVGTVRRLAASWTAERAVAPAGGRIRPRRGIPFCLTILASVPANYGGSGRRPSPCDESEKFRRFDPGVSSSRDRGE